jgi:hypothetical protein
LSHRVELCGGVRRRSGAMFKLPFGSKAPPSPASHVCEILVEIEQREAEKW